MLLPPRLGSWHCSSAGHTSSSSEEEAVLGRPLVPVRRAVPPLRSVEDAVGEVALDIVGTAAR
jgi:hypothetical protein